MGGSAYRLISPPFQRSHQPRSRQLGLDQPRETRFTARQLALVEMGTSACITAQSSRDGASKGRREVLERVERAADALVVGLQCGQLDGEQEGEAVAEFG